MNRALRAAALGVLLLTPVALTACSAGQVTQTASQERAKAGGMASAGDITLREARLASPLDGTYTAGQNARLIVAIANNGPSADTLTSITGDDFASAEITAAASATTSAASTSSTAAATTSEPSATDSTATDSTSSESSSSATSSKASRSSAESSAILSTVDIPATTNVFLGEESGPTVTLTGLHSTLTVGQHITVTLTFSNAGPISVIALVDTPETEAARGSAYDFEGTDAEG